MIRASTNTLSLNWRNSYKGKSEKCPYDDCDIETLEHFLIDCTGYENIRNELNFPANYHDKDQLIAKVLLFDTQDNSDRQKDKQFIKNIWKTRNRKIQATPD